jgi:hypothetical protein
MTRGHKKTVPDRALPNHKKEGANWLYVDAIKKTISFF